MMRRTALCWLCIAGVTVAGSASPNQEPEPKPPRPILRFYDQDLALKHLTPDSQGRDDPRFSDLLLRVSLVQPIAVPDRFHKHPVRLEGFLIVRLEENVLYLSREHADYGITNNGLWIDFDPAAWRAKGMDPRQFDGKYVLIEGIFDKNFHGNLGEFPGMLREVWSVQELQQRRH